MIPALRARDMDLLELDRISHAYDGRPVVRALSLSLRRGAIGCLLGPSGCGKTTVLRAIAGFEHVADGGIRIAGALVSGPGVHVPPERRRVGMVFQEHALFPHLTVAENVGFGLRRVARGERAARVAELLAQVGLEGRGASYPDQLSGGQQQRVAVARALAPRPDLLLLDEPFSSLDVDLRERLAAEVRAVIRNTGTTAVLVTHDQHEAFAMADEIGVMHEGRILQWATPYDLYHRPESRAVADFVGEGVFLTGALAEDGDVVLELGRVRASVPRGHAARGRVAVLVRPSDVVHDATAAIRAELVAKAFRGAEFLYRLRLPGGGEVLALVPSHHAHPIGDRVGIRLDVDRLACFPEEDVGEPTSARGALPR
jgi:iron(III) transport system ATP-binding protein